MFDPNLLQLAESVLDKARAESLRIATAESCTGGLVAALLTEIAGASDVFERGFIVYSNAAKAELLGVPDDLIENDGAVSESVARAMAEGALKRSDAQAAVAVTGIAGPGGGTAEKPVGLVHIAAAREGRQTLHEKHLFCPGTAGVLARIAAGEHRVEQSSGRANKKETAGEDAHGPGKNCDIGRTEIRMASVDAALKLLLQLL